MTAPHKRMSVRERILAALRREPVDYVPCSPFFNPLREQQRVGYRWQFPWGPSVREQVEYLINELDVDPVVGFSVGRACPATGVTSRVWLENAIIHKIWTTSSGELHASVKYNENWPHGLDIPFFSDFNVAHCVEPWLKSEQDLDCLRHILRPAEDSSFLAKLRFSFAQTKRLADRRQLPIMSTVGYGLTGALHLFGPTQLCIKMVDEPDLVDRYLEMEHELNVHDMGLALDLGVDIIRRNGFYETADFYGPKMLEQFLAKRLRREIETVHQADRAISYTVHTGVMPMLDYLRRLDFDCLMHIDTGFHGVDLAAIRDSQEDRKSFWLGPSNTYHMWRKDPHTVRDAVREVFDVFGKRGLLITPCPSAHSIMPWENSLAMIDEWKKLRDA